MLLMNLTNIIINIIRIIIMYFEEGYHNQNGLNERLQSMYRKV